LAKSEWKNSVLIGSLAKTRHTPLKWFRRFCKTAFIEQWPSTGQPPKGKGKEIVLMNLEGL
jgi:hypothetical protein